MEYSRELAMARVWAEGAGRLLLRQFRSPHLRFEIKPDGTPVTPADREAEELLREAIGKAFPGDGILGEEGGEEGVGERRWILDPLDGTKNFVRGIPIFGVLVALEVKGEPVVGVVHAPALGSTWWAARGMGAWRDGERIRVSSVARLEDAFMLHGSVREFLDRGAEAAFLALARATSRQRGFGDFWSHLLVAEGAAEIMLEPLLAPWDFAPLKVIVEEAGGRLTDFEGGFALRPSSCLTTNGILHEAALAVLAANSPGRP